MCTDRDRNKIGVQKLCALRWGANLYREESVFGILVDRKAAAVRAKRANKWMGSMGKRAGGREREFLVIVMTCFCRSQIADRWQVAGDRWHGL